MYVAIMCVYVCVYICIYIQSVLISFLYFIYLKLCIYCTDYK